MENKKKTINKQENKNVGIAITDSQIARRLSRFKELIRDLGKEPRPEILPFRESSKDVGERNKEKIPSSQCLRAGYYKGGQGTHISASQGQRVYGTDGESVAIKSVGGGQGAKTGLYAFLTPDRPEKRQEGRRFKEEGEPSFTLTGQDIHGVMEIQKEIDNGGRITRKNDGTSFTLGGGGRNNGRNQIIGFENMRIRRLTPVECERLQGFPDGFTEGFSDTQRYKMMGNAVTVNVIGAVGGKLI